MPDEFIRYGDSWAKLHPDWEMKLWTDENIPTLINQMEYDKTDNPILRADMARLELLYRFGGIYIDCDFECLKNIEPLLHNINAFSARQDDYIIATGIMGCTPGHPAFRTLVHCMTDNIELNRNHLLTCQAGPVYITEFLQGVRGVIIFSKEIFYPYYYTEMHRKGEEFPEAYAVHHWAGSWLKKEG
jgi:mannosyltransferase OCH1-like enzyme